MPDALSRDEVERVATLARLALTEEEKTLYARQLMRVLDHARQVASVDTSSVPPTSSVSESDSHERPDVVRPSLDRRDALANAADTSAGLFRVPRVLGEE